MKKFFTTNWVLLLLLSACCSSAIAQTITPATSTQKHAPGTEIRLGFTSAYFAAPYNNDIESSGSKMGFYGGVIFDYPLKEKISLQTGLIISEKGGKIDAYDAGDRALRVDAIYAQIPVYVSLHFPIQRYGNTVYFNFGPYFGYGMMGKTKLYDESMYTFESSGPMNQFDLGFGTDLQFEFKNRIIFTVGADGGFVRSLKQEWVTTDAILGNNSIYLSIGYKLKK